MIGTNKKDATETVALLLDDARAGLLPARGEGTLEALLEERGVEAGPLRRLGGDRRGRAQRRRAARASADQARSWDELLAAAKSIACCTESPVSGTAERAFSADN